MAPPLEVMIKLIVQLINELASSIKLATSRSQLCSL